MLDEGHHHEHAIPADVATLSGSALTSARPKNADPHRAELLDAYAQWLHHERRELAREMYPGVERPWNFTPENTGAADFHFGGVDGSWRDTPRPSTRAASVLAAAGCNWQISGVPDDGAALARAITAYRDADAAYDVTGELINKAMSIYRDLGGSPPRPDALFYRDEDHALGLYHSAMYQDDDRVYTVNSIPHLREAPRLNRREIHHPATIADGFRQEDVDAGAVRTEVVREPWPEAQARADEIVAAWDAWGAEHTRRLNVSGLQQAQEVSERAYAAKTEAARALAWVKAHDLAGILKKVAIVFAMHGDATEFLSDSLVEADGDDQRLVASIVHDLMLMNGALPEPVAYLQAAE